MIYYMHLVKRYLKSATDVKRIVDNLRGPLVGRYAEANAGLLVIRAYNKQEYFENFMAATSDDHMMASMNEFWGQIWIGLITQIVAAFMVGGCAFFAVTVKNSNYELMGTWIGLALTQSL